MAKSELNKVVIEPIGGLCPDAKSACKYLRAKVRAELELSRAIGNGIRGKRIAKQSSILPILSKVIERKMRK